MDGDVVEKPAGTVMKIEGRIGGLSQIRSQIRAELEFGRKFLPYLSYDPGIANPARAVQESTGDLRGYLTSHFTRR